MSASLVGSEMCIRDRCWRDGGLSPRQRLRRASTRVGASLPTRPCPAGTVSYTHLTLPTIA
eukprot:5482830-Alexandrium_andersonii.AAC.1